MDSFAQFMTVYQKELFRAVTEHPEEYAWPVDDVPRVAGRMGEAFKDNSFNKDSRAIKATCKALGIKHTYTAIRAFLSTSSEASKA